MRFALGILAALAACHGTTHQRQPPKPVAVVADAPVPPPVVALDPHATLHVESLGSPMQSARTWTSALVPNARGGWNFITQSWELESRSAPEYVVIQLETGVVSLMDAGQMGYAVNKYQVRNQLRAANGRVFFPLSGVGLAYYDPTDETVKDLPPIDTAGPDKIIYDAKFGPDGMLYGGTQSDALPTIVQIDPNTLKTRVLGHVGKDRKHYSYAYQIAIDLPWIYSTVGELPWELAALNVKTGESKILAVRPEHGWMQIQAMPDGVRAQLITDIHTPKQASEYVWCVDGKTFPVGAPGDKLPFKARNFAPPAKALPDAPELDITQLKPDSRGVGRVRWRAQGTTDWKTVEFQVKHTSPIKIEALTALPGGGVLGGTKQYHGFFKTADPPTTTEVLGGPSPSQTKFGTLDGTIYMAGYPNGVLYAYDPKQAWTGGTGTEPDANPRKLGNFTQAGAKYGYFLVPLENRIYFAGRLERDGEGSGIGYYEPATKQFGGHHDKLASVEPAGLAVLPDTQRIVFSGRARKRVKNVQAELVVYDRDLVELDRMVVEPGNNDAGLIFTTPTANTIVGFIADNPAVYRFDLGTKQLVDKKWLAAEVTAVAQRPGDGSLWTIIDKSLVRIDPLTLESVTFGAAGSMPAGVDQLVWQGDDLYASAESELFRIARVGLP